MIGNRLRTITGENAGLIQSLSRLLYYFFGTSKWKKAYHKLGALFIPAKNYRELLKMENAEFSDEEIRQKTEAFSASPSFAVVIIGDDTDAALQTFAAIQKQLYNRFAVYASDKQVASDLHIDRVSQGSALQDHKFVLMLNAGDLPDRKCLFLMADAYNRSREACVMYTDEDREKQNGERCEPLFKPGWSPDLFAEKNYIRHAALRSSWMDAIVFDQSAETILENLLTARSLKRCEIINVNRVLISVSGEKESTVDQKPTSQKVFSGSEKISIVIPTKNKTDLVRQCITSIKERSTYHNYEIILVDNRSDEDDFFAYVQELGTDKKVDFTCVKADMEFNFSLLVNLGVSIAKGDYILLLNNDVEVITPEWMELLLEKASDEHVGAVGVKLLYPDKTIQHAGIVLSPEKVSEHVFVGKQATEKVYDNALNTTRNYLAVTAACIMIHKDKYNKVGGFDEQFRVEYNDIDFCLKLYDAGYYNVYLPHVQLFHYESASRRHPHSDPESYARHLSEKQMMEKKWGQYIMKDPFFIFNRINPKVL
jgi:GT2 family glycosyltransferase